MPNTPQAYYEYAKQKYNEGRRLIGTLSEAEKASGFVGIMHTLKCYDLMLQIILFRAAIADKTVYGNEKQFIKDITADGDIVTEINKEAKLNLTWDTIPRLNGEALITVNKLLNTLAPKYADDLCNLFARYDYKRTKGKSYDTLIDIFASIISAFSLVDGDAVGSADAKVEQTLAYSAIGQFLSPAYNKWMKIFLS